MHGAFKGYKNVHIVFKSLRSVNHQIKLHCLYVKTTLKQVFL